MKHTSDGDALYSHYVASRLLNGLPCAQWVAYASDDDAKYSHWNSTECVSRYCLEAHARAGMLVDVGAVRGLLEQLLPEVRLMGMPGGSLPGVLTGHTQLPGARAALPAVQPAVPHTFSCGLAPLPVATTCIIAGAEGCERGGAVAARALAAAAAAEGGQHGAVVGRGIRWPPGRGALPLRGDWRPSPCSFLLAICSCMSMA